MRPGEQAELNISSTRSCGDSGFKLRALVQRDGEASPTVRRLRLMDFYNQIKKLLLKSARFARKYKGSPCR